MEEPQRAAGRHPTSPDFAGCSPLHYSEPWGDVICILYGTVGSLIPFGGRLHEIAARLAGKLLKIAPIMARTRGCARTEPGLLPGKGWEQERDGMGEGAV